VLIAYEQRAIDLHAWIWVRYDGAVDASDTAPESVTEEPGGTILKVYGDRRMREDTSGQVISQYIRTTPGRIIFNQVIQDVLAA
ncbi:MAG: DNA-directed RNA polymerase subunit gamma, partial [Cyanobacteria bacterium P01_D01_bin.123]